MEPHEREDLERLASYDFEGRNEAEIRGDWIEPLLRLLGYGLGTRHRILREERLQLQPPSRMIGSARLEIDFVPTVFGKRLWIIEAKRPQDDLFTPEHLGQAWSYATDPRVRVPLMMLCDGARLAVFDVTRVEWEKPVFDHSKGELVERFDDLFALLGAPHVAESVRRHQLEHLRQSLEAQVSLDALDETIRDVAAIVEQVRPAVVARRDEIRSEARERLERAGEAALNNAGMWGHAQALNGPHWFRWSDIDRAVELVLRQDPLVRKREFDDFELATTPQGEQHPRMWFPLRVVRLGCAVQLIEAEGCGEYCHEVAAMAARDHSDGFADDELLLEVYRLQRLLGPLGWRLAAAAKPSIDAKAEALVKGLDAEEWLRLEGEIGVTATAGYLRMARLAPIAIQVKITPWDAPTVHEWADAAEALLEGLPRRREFDHLQPAGDPWLDSWLTSDPLRSFSKHVLERIASNSATESVGDFARELLREFEE